MGSILDSFELLNSPELPFITLSKYGITFSKNSLIQLEYAHYVHAYIDRKRKLFAVKPCPLDEAALELVSHSKQKPNYIRWRNRSLLRTLASLSGADVNSGSVRIRGKYIPDEDVIIFDLKETSLFSSSKPK